jgi:hypothetical protein
MSMRQLLTLLCLASFSWAAETTTTNPPLKSSENEPSAEELQTIRKILELPPDRLTRVRAALERLEHMPPEARKEYAASLEKLENASPDERRKMMKEMRGGGFNGRILEHYLKTLPPEKAKEEMARIRAMSPEKRTEFIHSLAEKFGPEIGKGKNKQPPAETSTPASPTTPTAPAGTGG